MRDAASAEEALLEAVEQEIDPNDSDDDLAYSGHRDVKFDDLAEYFDMPIQQVSAQLGVCATVLKKICRRNGILRWPHRRVKSLDRMIARLQKTVPATPEEASRIAKEIEIMRAKRVNLFRNPNLIETSQMHRASTKLARKVIASTVAGKAEIAAANAISVSNMRARSVEPQLSQLSSSRPLIGSSSPSSSTGSFSSTSYLAPYPSYHQDVSNIGEAPSSLADNAPSMFYSAPSLFSSYAGSVPYPQSYAVAPSPSFSAPPSTVPSQAIVLQGVDSAIAKKPSLFESASEPSVFAHPQPKSQFSAPLAALWAAAASDALSTSAPSPSSTTTMTECRSSVPTPLQAPIEPESRSSCASVLKYPSGMSSLLSVDSSYTALDFARRFATSPTGKIGNSSASTVDTPPKLPPLGLYGSERKLPSLAVLEPRV